MKKLLFSLALLCPSLWAAEFSLLGGHLSISLPDEAVYGQRSTSLMGPGPGDDETLIWIGDGSERVAIFARELGRYAPADFRNYQRAAMQKVFGMERFEYVDFERGVYNLATKAPNCPSGANILATADLFHEDGTMQRLQFVFAEERVKDMEACRKLVRDALASLKAGGKSLPLHAREENIAQVDREGNCLILPLPEGCHAVHAEGADFLLNDYTILRKEADSPGFLRVYLGHHPNAGEEDTAQESRESSILGKKCTWKINRFPENERSYGYCADCLLPVNDAGLYVHLIIAAEGEAELEQHISWAESLRLEKPAEREAPKDSAAQ